MEIIRIIRRHKAAAPSKDTPALEEPAPARPAPLPKGWLHLSADVRSEFSRYGRVDFGDPLVTARPVRRVA